MSIDRFVLENGAMRRDDNGDKVYYYDHLQVVNGLQQQLANARDVLAAGLADLEACKAELRRIYEEQAQAAGWRA